MRLYKSFLVVVILIAIGWGVWYCVSNYNNTPSNIDGTLVNNPSLQMRVAFSDEVGRCFTQNIE